MSLRRLLAVGPLLAIALTLEVVVLISTQGGTSAWAEDFRTPIYDAARTLVNGGNPYPNEHHDFVRFPAVVVPPAVLFLVAPLTYIPKGLAVGLWLALLTAAVLAVPPALRIRDKRCWLLWLTCPAVLIALYHGNTLLLVALALALAWRYRDRPGIGGGMVTCAVVLKFWPVVFVFWLLATRRFRAAALVALGAPIVVFGSWALIGFRGLDHYPAMLKAMTRDLASRGAFVISALVNAGVDYSWASGIGVAIAIVVLAFALRRGDFGAFVCSALAGLASTATCWFYYLAVPAVAVGIRARHFETTWLYLPALWLAVDARLVAGRGGTAVMAVALTAALGVRLLRDGGLTETR